MSLLALEQLRYAWPGQAPLLDIPSFALAAGERVFLHGPSGSGKSTLLSLVAGVIVPQSGRILLEDTDLAALGSAERDRWRADELGFVFQQFNLLPYLSVLENVLLPLRFSAPRRQRLKAAPTAEAARLLGDLKLSPALWTTRADTLSIGQQQRVAVARALIGRPPLVIADEPTSALDADSQQAFLDLLFSECDQHGSALLFVSHDLRLAGRFDRQLALVDLNRVATTPGAAA